MITKLWNALLAMFGLGPASSSTRPGQRVATDHRKAEPASAPTPRHRVDAPPPAPTVQKPPERRLHVGATFEVTEDDRSKARAILIKERNGESVEPTVGQEQVILSNSASMSVLAGAGSGKSSTLVRRVLFLHVIKGIALENIAVFTFTRKSRKDFVDRLVEEAPYWGTTVSEAKALRVVRTFHSKALQVGRRLLQPGQTFFEFLGAPNKRRADAEFKEDTSLTPEEKDEEAANEIEGLSEGDFTDAQAQVLRDAYARAYSSDERFRLALKILFDFSCASQQLAPDEKYNQKLAHISKLRARDNALCDHLEQRWASQLIWPIQGVVDRSATGQRYQLDVHGTKLLSNGFSPALGVYVILGGYPGISTKEISVAGKRIKPKLDAGDKVKILLTAADEPIRIIRSQKDADILRRQIQMATQPTGLSAPNVDLRLPGEFGYKPAYEALYGLGLFAENIGLKPTALDQASKSEPLSQPERAAVDATASFFRAFESMLEERGLTTFNHLFKMLGIGSPSLSQLDIGDLMSAKYLLIDEFQDISPLIVRFVRGLHEELWKKSSQKQTPSLVCVGDDWQSIYGWRGSSPHFLLNFHETFPGAPRKCILLQENFRSSQKIIDCGEAFIHRVAMKSPKYGVASNPSVKDLPTKTVWVEEFDANDVAASIRLILDRLKPKEKLFLLASKHDELKPFENIRHKRLTKTTFHQSKGLEAAYVVLLGATKNFGSHAVKNMLYRLVKFPQTFDAAQRDEMLRVAYVANTRAARACIWYAEANPSNVLAVAPADGQSLVAMERHKVIPHLEAILPRLKG